MCKVLGSGWSMAKVAYGQSTQSYFASGGLPELYWGYTMSLRIQHFLTALINLILVGLVYLPRHGYIGDSLSVGTSFARLSLANGIVHDIKKIWTRNVGVNGLGNRCGRSWSWN